MKGLTGVMRSMLAPTPRVSGEVWVFSADHKLELYPGCGTREGNSYRQGGIEKLEGTWRLLPDGMVELKMVRAVPKPPLVPAPAPVRMAISLVGEDLSMAGEMLGRYSGPLPQVCAAK